MPDNRDDNCFVYRAEYSGLIIELTSDETSLFKLDFVKEKNNKKSNVNSDPINRALAFLDDYFSGRKSRIDPCLYRSGDSVSEKNPCKLYLKVSGYTDKEIEIYKNLLNVKPGKTLSYSELALISGITGGARFAGNCMARNIFPVIIPCHRVVKKDGSMGNYTGGVWIKELLLKHEQSCKWI